MQGLSYRQLIGDTHVMNVCQNIFSNCLLAKYGRFLSALGVCLGCVYAGIGQARRYG